MPYSDSPQPGELALEERAEDGRHTLVLKGELDLVTGPSLETAITSICVAGAEELLLDLGGLRFADSMGLRALFRSSEVCQRYGCKLLLTRALPSIEHMFKVSGLAQTLPFAARGSGPNG